MLCCLQWVWGLGPWGSPQSSGCSVSGAWCRGRGWPRCLRPAPAAVLPPPGANLAVLCASRCWMSCPSCCSSTGSSMRCVSHSWWGALGHRVRVRLTLQALHCPHWALRASGVCPGLGSATLLCGRFSQWALAVCSFVCSAIHPSIYSLHGGPCQACAGLGDTATLPGGHSSCPQGASA